MFYSDLYRQCPTNSKIYTISGDETLYDIANKFGITVDDILLANPNINPLNIYVGLEICIPTKPTGASNCPIGTSPYEIKNGDTLYSIAQKFNTTLEAILTSNPGINPDMLYVGQIICIAENPPSIIGCPSLNTYVIQNGDTLYNIANAFNVTLQDLLSVNPNINPNNLYEGAVICLPIAPTPLSITISIQSKTLTLYNYGKALKTYPVAVGKPTTPSPIGTFTIINKQVNPGGPFGTRWMGLSIPHYGIHGTNNPASIGTAASNGCIRMYNQDVNELFNYVTVGTVVRIF